VDEIPKTRDVNQELECLVELCILALENGNLEEVERIKARHPAQKDALTARLAWLEGSGLLGGQNEELPEAFGDYRVLDEIGRGGMGAVYRAEQLQPVQRQVALKVLKLGMDSREILARFAIERETLARMSHEHVAQIFDAGVTPNGRPFIAMELVDGEPITDYCDSHGLATDDRLRLFARVCDAVQHAHQNSIIHRDLKPSNILVVERDGEPVPKIIDFGIAKSLDEAAPDRSLATLQGQLIGTPEYMSPEQAAGDTTIDTRVDVFALGVVLYELLAGALPFEPTRLRNAGFAGLLRILIEETPATPSNRLTSLGDRAKEIAKRRGTEVSRLRRRLRGDLDLIVMTALAKDRDDRYATPSEFAADVRRFLAHEPVLAAQPSFRYRFGKFARKHRLAVSAGASLLALLLIGTAGTTWGFVDASRNLELANSNLTKANENLKLARSAVDSMLHRLAMTGLDNTPRTLKLRRDLLLDAQQYHEAFLAANPGDANTRFKAAEVAADLGKILRRLGDYPGAEASLAKAERVMKELVAETGDPKVRLELAGIYNDNIERFATQKNAELGGNAFKAAAAVLEDLEQERPNDPDVIDQLARLHHNHAILLDNTGGEGGPAADRMIEYRARLVALKPDSIGTACDLACAQQNRAVAYIRIESWDQALALLDQSRTVLNAALKKHPDHEYGRSTLGHGLSTAAEVHRARGEFESSAKLSRRAIGIYDTLIDEQPARNIYKQQYALAVYSLVRTETVRFGEATKLLRRAKTRMEQALQKNPENAMYKQILGIINTTLEKADPKKD